MDYRYRIATSSGVEVQGPSDTSNAGIQVFYLNAGQTLSVRAANASTAPTIAYQAQEFFAP